ncbi:MAG TPA: ACP S-malonyltransferase [Gammaproteobacteria bacterium]
MLTVSSRKLLFVFPGQGSQYAGMGSDLVEEFEDARRVYDEASETLGYDMRELSFRDPRGELSQTRFTQPALLTHQVACLESLRSLAGAAAAPALAAGHSLGEYGALVAAGALTFRGALLLVQERGRLMSEHGSGGMVATTLDLAAAAALADKHYCGIGGCNLPDQTVVAGEERDLEALVADLEKTHPGKRAIKLNTEGAFHTYLMVTAARKFREVLERTELGPPTFDVLSNYTGKLHEREPDAIRSRLFFQLFNPVRWIGCMNTAIDAGVDTIVELGGGIGKGEGPGAKRPNLEGIVKKSLKWREREAEYLPAIHVAGIRAAAERLAGA